MISIRAYAAEDSAALYAISLATGHLGGDASHLYADGTLPGHIYAGPYAVLAPDLVLVAIDAEGVAGFVLGALDTLEWEARLERDWWPSLRARYRDPAADARGAWTADQRRASMIHHPEHAPRAVANAFPAHLHLNLLPRIQGHGDGGRLLSAWLELAARHGAQSAHVAANRGNARAIRFWWKSGFTDVTPADQSAERTTWLGRHGDARAEVRPVSS
ncbi:hypothetical protein [Phenylobacterium sp.]|uniref:hypothetical protein n=1 Tax=Phenylobacterium sp. TaxID=1871053 RepID=UPI0027366938|nr:hypothetical protein [Phenylobacterium sp.]MDP3659085.1 hypothetical protein [Phenylobacterium sp.]